MFCLGVSVDIRKTHACLPLTTTGLPALLRRRRGGAQNPPLIEAGLRLRLLLLTDAALCRAVLQGCVQRLECCVDGADCRAAEHADAEVWVQAQQVLDVRSHDVVAFEKPWRGGVRNNTGNTQTGAGQKSTQAHTKTRAGQQACQQAGGGAADGRRQPASAGCVRLHAACCQSGRGGSAGGFRLL